MTWNDMYADLPPDMPGRSVVLSLEYISSRKKISVDATQASLGYRSGIATAVQGTRTTSREELRKTMLTVNLHCFSGQVL